jgi:iron complex transport system ATP-binding protein
VLDLLEELNETDGRTIVMVLHDLNQACRYSGHLVAMKDGAIHAQGEPAAIVHSEMAEAVYGLAAHVVPHPIDGGPLCLPLGRRDRDGGRATGGSAGVSATGAPAPRPAET